MQTSAIFAYLNAGNCSYCILFIEDLLDVSATATATTTAAASRVLLLFNDAFASTSSTSSSTYQVVSDLFLLVFMHALLEKCGEVLKKNK